MEINIRNTEKDRVTQGYFPQQETLFLLRQKVGDLTQSYDKSPYTNRNVKRAKWQHKQRQKSSIKQQLRTDLGRSVGVTTATQLVWLTWFTGPPSHSPQQPCNQKDTHLKICK